RPPPPEAAKPKTSTRANPRSAYAVDGKVTLKQAACPPPRERAEAPASDGETSRMRPVRPAEGPPSSRSESLLRLTAPCATSAPAGRRPGAEPRAVAEAAARRPGAGPPRTRRHRVAAIESLRTKSRAARLRRIGPHPRCPEPITFRRPRPARQGS